MNITIDMRMINSSGIGTYLKNLVPIIITYYNNDQFYLLGIPTTLHKLGLSNKKNVTVIACDAPIYSVQEQYALMKLIPKNTDLLWSPHYNIPVCYSGRMLATVHDVCHLAHPEWIEGLHKKLYARFMFQQVKRKAQHILTVSDFSKSEMVKFVGIDERRITVTHLGVDSSWFRPVEKHPIYHKPFFLYVGNVKQNKNISRLLEAFSRVQGHIPHDLIIVGKKEGFITGDDKTLQQAELLSDRVYFTGYVDDETLKQYFIRAEALVFPSLYEGFGLPPLEAMACGCPVIVSNIASIPEVCGDAALYCNPYQVEEIVEKIMIMVND